jgi:glycosyltransferase involved in cell wall biosynthesis
LKLYIVGGDVPDEIQQLRRLGNVEVTGWVEDVRPYYAKSAIVIAPLRLGGGMRGKILEAWAMGRPVVSTRVGAEGLDYDNGSDIIVADGEEEFAHAIQKLFDEPSLQKEIGLKGRKRAVKQYTWEAVAEGYEKLYYELLKEK